MSAAKKKQTGSHPRTRSDHATELAEDYVEAIAETIEARGVCRVVDLASQFEVSHVTVNRTVGRLVRDGYAKTEPYSPITLTAKGKKLARIAAERHAIVLEFLKAIGVSEAAAIVDSEGIEHHVSKETLDAMKAFVAGRRPEIRAE
ncbi:MAG: manganese-binding transcriptional regulator MntR [Planctomycetales bacterium]|nr:manganese-binding transcriptional regulator MntR [Planctomycetales bacterium]